MRQGTAGPSVVAEMPREATPSSAHVEAAALLHELWAGGRTVAQLPGALRPRTPDDGWAVQRALDAHMGEPAGWKLAATNPVGQAQLGADGPLAGRLHAGCLRSSVAEIDATANTMGVAEAEFAFRIAHDLAPAPREVTRAAVVAAVAAVVPAIEVPESRFNDHLAAGLSSLIADGLCFGHLVLGAPVAEWDPEQLASWSVRVRCGGGPPTHGSGAAVLGDPVAALVWLTRRLHRHGLTLRAGEVVTTGACAPPTPVRAGDLVHADFGVLGEVSMRLVG
jgi:2-keto-4-pentenoate hydratase